MRRASTAKPCGSDPRIAEAWACVTGVDPKGRKGGIRLLGEDAALPKIK
jgi:hypothetical protein